MAECLIPAFVNNVPTIDPLPDFPIVCPVVFPPALAIPDVPLPPCIDGFNITGSDISVTITMASEGTTPTGDAKINVTPSQCAFDISGYINLVIPSGGGGGGGGGGADFPIYDSEEDIDCLTPCDDIRNALIAALTGITLAGGEIVKFANGASYLIALPVPGEPVPTEDCPTFLICEGDVTFYATALNLPCPGKELWDFDVSTGRLVCGTVNQVLPSNWSGLFSTTDGTYITLTCTASSGRVTGVTVNDGITPPSAPTVLEGAAPTSFDVMIGVITGGRYIKCCAAKPFLAVPTVQFRTDRATPVLGLSNYINWWTWGVTQS